jgi:hypothetical protein
MQVAKIEHVELLQGALGRLVGYGTIAVRGSGGTPEPFTTVKDPMAFRKAIQGQIAVAPPVRVA